MQKTDKIEQAIRIGLDYIGGQQLPGGGFASFSSPSRIPFIPELKYKTTFAPSLILSALTGIDMPESRGICRQAADYLRRQASPAWSFNYWSKRTKERRTKPYPDDLDDSFCALAALYAHDPSVVDAGVLAKATKLLLATESAVGGPYRTWLVSADSKAIWLDVDVAVNANIAYFLTLLGSPLPKLTSFLDGAIEANKLRSPYYPGVHVPAYYIARGYNGNQTARLKTILQKLMAEQNTSLETALCVSSLLRLGAKDQIEKAVAALLDKQTADGAWPAAAFCLDPEIDGQTYYNGAPALTTAFAVEALQLYRQAAQSSITLVRRKSKAQDSQNQLLQASVLKLAQEQCLNLRPELKTATLGALKKIANSKNGQEITGLAGSFRQSLIKPPSRLKRDFVATLGLANLYGWLAYTIYDDFLDEEGKPELISIANVAMRRSLDNYFTARPSDRAFHHLVRRTFDTIDGANAWELAHCRFERSGNSLKMARLPDYGNLSRLAERSIGHALSPMAVLAAAGEGPDTPAAQNLLKSFRHYLIARQLNDDAHDWPEDLQNGHITPVVAQLFTGLKLKPQSYELSDLLAAARPQFWSSTLLEVCRLMRHHVSLSRQALKRSAVLSSDNVVNDLLDRLEASLDDTLQQQSQAKEFLKQYGHTTSKEAKP